MLKIKVVLRDESLTSYYQPSRGCIPSKAILSCTDVVAFVRLLYVCDGEGGGG